MAHVRSWLKKKKKKGYKLQSNETNYIHLNTGIRLKRSHVPLVNTTPHGSRIESLRSKRRTFEQSAKTSTGLKDHWTSTCNTDYLTGTCNKDYLTGICNKEYLISTCHKSAFLPPALFFSFFIFFLPFLFFFFFLIIQWKFTVLKRILQPTGLLYCCCCCSCCC